MTFTLLLINSLSQIFYLMSAMPSEGLNPYYLISLIAESMVKRARSALLLLGHPVLQGL